MHVICRSGKRVFGGESFEMIGSCVRVLTSWIEFGEPFEPPPVLLIVMLLFSILGVEFFRESENVQCALLFRRLDIAMFTMFVVMTGQ